MLDLPTFYRKRGRPLNQLPLGSGPVVYWLSRDQRARDNWALLTAQTLALDRQVPLAVVFCLAPQFLGAARRHYDFLLAGLQETAAALAGNNIAFYLLQGDPGTELPHFLNACGAGLLVTDFDPLRLKRAWRQAVLAHTAVAAWEVDAHNIIPCWLASPKPEFAAYTFRPKVHRLLPDFLDDFPPLLPHPHPWPEPPAPLDVAATLAWLAPDEGVPPVPGFIPGETAAHAALHGFLRYRLASYATARNDPTLDGQSNLSPYLHFGHLAPQRLALAVQRAAAPAESRQAFLEELIVRRELADNFCYYTPGYDQTTGFPPWARQTLDKHRPDDREYLYSQAQFEAGATHDPLWNAAQQQLVRQGKMHGYLRMYWAKKILEWTPSPEEALAIAIFLNDRYSLDGRDPNGYTGIAWSIGGVHDRPWPERPIFGKIRYMNYAGCRRKFKVDEYIAQIQRDSAGF